MTVLTAQPSRNLAALILRWTARLSSLVSVGLLLAFLGPGEKGMPTLPEVALMMFFPFGVMAGMVLGWWKELQGGLVTIASLALFYAMMAVQRGQMPSTLAFAIFAIPGALFVAAALARRNSN